MLVLQICCSAGSLSDVGFESALEQAFGRQLGPELREPDHERVPVTDRPGIGIHFRDGVLNRGRGFSKPVVGVDVAEVRGRNDA